MTKYFGLPELVLPRLGNIDINKLDIDILNEMFRCCRLRRPRKITKASIEKAKFLRTSSKVRKVDKKKEKEKEKEKLRAQIIFVKAASCPDLSGRSGLPQGRAGSKMAKMAKLKSKYRWASKLDMSKHFKAARRLHKAHKNFEVTSYSMRNIFLSDKKTNQILRIKTEILEGFGLNIPASL